MPNHQDIKRSISINNYSRTNNEKIRLLLLFVFSGFIIFFNLWNGSLYPWDEAAYGEIAREIVTEKLGWLTLHNNFVPWFDKPPLYIWMIAVAFKIFGINEFSVRCWSALFGLGTVMLLYFLTKRLFRSNNLALFSSLSLLSFYFFIRHARQGMLDVPLTFFVLLGVFLFLLGQEKPWVYIFVVPAFAIAFLIKSFAVFPFLIILISIIFFTGQRRILANKFFLSGIIIGILISFPWHIHQYINHGMGFVDGYFLTHLVKRTTGVIDAHKGGIDYYFIKILLNKPIGFISIITLPYFIFLFIKENNNERKSAFFLVIVSIATILLFYTFVKTKLPWYIIPVYPFLSISTVISISHIFSKTKHEKKLAFIALIILLSIPIIKLIDTDRHRTLDYRPHLKESSLTIRNNSTHGDIILYYNISEIPTAQFYTERKAMWTVSKGDILNAISDSDPFIVLMAKEDNYYEELKKIKVLNILNENNKYIVFKKI